MPPRPWPAAPPTPPRHGIAQARYTTLIASTTNRVPSVDTLLAEYLSARGMPPRHDDALRRAYWLAAASNVLAGALRYHVHMATSEEAGGAGRAAALQAAGDALRIIRRADAWWQAP